MPDFSGWGAEEILTIDGCLDASSYAGVSFWAKGSRHRGGFLVTAPCTGGDTLTGCNWARMDFALTSEWTEYRIIWSAFSDGPNGPLDPSMIKYLQFFNYPLQAGQTETLDQWVDDIALFADAPAASASVNACPSAAAGAGGSGG